MKSYRINVILPFTMKTGGIKVILEYVDGLNRAGYDVVCYVPMIYYKFKYEGFIGLLKRIKASIYNTIIRGKNIKWFDGNIDVKLVPVIGERYIRDADIVIATAWPTANSVNKLSRNKGKKIYFIQGYEIWSGNEDEVNKTYEYDMKQIVISRELKKIMECKFNKNNISVIHNGIRLEDFYYSNKINKEITISTLYHPNRNKGYYEAIEVIRIIKESIPNIKVKIFGTTIPDFIPEYVEFYHNPTKEVLREIYSESEMYIFCSKNEGWGLTPIEAMACKTVVLGNNDGCIKEIGIDNVNCIIADSGNIIEMAAKGIEILKDEEKRRMIKENAYKLAIDMKWEKSLERFKNIIDDLLFN